MIKLMYPQVLKLGAIINANLYGIIVAAYINKKTRTIFHAVLNLLKGDIIQKGIS